MTSIVERAIAAQERAVTAAAPLFVRACPGAGKTHVIVSRHLRGPSVALRHGRALLSFTRAAATQMRRRCHREGRPEATTFPHYIGTLDAFIWDVLVVPYLPASKPLRLLDSWDRVQAEVKLDRTVPLSGFTFQRAPGAGYESIRQDLLSREHRRLIDGSNYPWSVWEKAALDARREQFQRGYVTGHESRLLALKFLNAGESVVGPLRSRFAEIIVDEAQDCSMTDLTVFEKLHRIGIPLVVVADPDQMIYGWRDADLARLDILEAELGQTVDLTGNWRSSPTICQLAATLRSGSRPPDDAVRPPQLEAPVILLPTNFLKGGVARHAPTGRPVVDVFLDHAQTYEVDVAVCLITAYSRSHLPVKNRRPAGNAATMLAHAWRVVHSATAEQSLVDDACRTGSRLLLRYWYPDAPAQGSLEARCTAVGVDFADIVRRAYGFLYALPEPNATWFRDVNVKLKGWPQPPGARPRGVIGQLRGKADGLRAAGAATAPFRSDNIHQVKGDEHPGVLLLVPEDDAGVRWINGDPAADEMLRNWYVAVTRAQRLIAVGVQQDGLEAIARHLGMRGVPFVVG
ncbi:UvrD-helicase domain-containing protein [Actinoplanes sp. CA-051413]|uniref:UvrD-helicase domain-containing protein n=1 Tax=Actinoplanes sp. CA-051413 TaxID=3239899 RepID=UPI003D96853B